MTKRHHGVEAVTELECVTHERVTVVLDHLIVLASRKQETAAFLAELLDLPAATPEDGPVPGFFLCLKVGELKVLFVERDAPPGHYAFRVEPAHFARIVDRLRDRGQTFWADPRMQLHDQIYEIDATRGLYVIDPSGHGIEVLTR